MLTLENVTITQGDFQLQADFSIQAGGITALIGPSGAGKSTLLGAICGFVPLASGRVLWGDNDITHLAPANRPMATLFQDNNLFPHLTVAQNVGLGVRPDLRLTAQDRQIVTGAIARVGLARWSDARASALSGGQQSRAALARVLVQNRALIMLDEPFAALGPAMRHEMLDLVAELAREKGATLIMVTHSPGDLERIADHAIFVAEGQAAKPEPAGALLKDPPPALKAYLGD